MSEQRPLWERQPWDTETSFSRFQKYYLVQAPPRSLAEAYRLYLQETSKKPARNQQANGTWNRWYYGQDSTGNPIPGAVGWRDRAAAYDDRIWAERREWHKQQTWELTELAFKRAKDMMTHPLVRQIVKDVDKDGRPITYIIEPARWTQKDAATLTQTFDKIARLDLGQPTERTAVHGGQDYSHYSDERIKDEIHRLDARAKSRRNGNLTSPSFRERAEGHGGHENEPESSEE